MKDKTAVWKKCELCGRMKLTDLEGDVCNAGSLKSTLGTCQGKLYLTAEEMEQSINNLLAVCRRYIAGECDKEPLEECIDDLEGWMDSEDMPQQMGWVGKERMDPS